MPFYIFFVNFIFRSFAPSDITLCTQTARNAGVPVILDAGGMDAPLPQGLLNCVDILSPNESELSRLTVMPTESFEQITEAVVLCHKMVSFGTLIMIIITIGIVCYCHFHNLKIYVKGKEK